MDMESIKKQIGEAFERERQDKEADEKPKPFRPEHLKRMGVTMMEGKNDLL